MPPEGTWAPPGQQAPAENADAVELLSEEEAGQLSEEDKEFRVHVGVPENAKSHPSWDNKRFRQVYRHDKETARENAQLREDMKLALEHSKRTAEAMENLAKVQTQNVTSEVHKKAEGIQAELQDMEQDLAAISDQKRAVRRNREMSEDNKWDKIEELEKREKTLERQIARKTSEAEAAVKEAKEAEKRTKETPKSEPEPAFQVAVREFVQTVPWYNPKSDDYDPLMADAAEKYDKALLMKEEWGAGKVTSLENNKARLAKVRKYIEDRFQWKGNGNGDGERRPVRLVEGVGDEQGDGRQKGAVRLTPMQKQIAHNMLDDVVGPAKAEAEYAKQLGVA